MNLNHSLQSKASGLKGKLLVVITALALALGNFVFALPMAAEAQATASVAVTSSVSYGQFIYVSGAGFAPNERISIWLINPNDKINVPTNDPKGPGYVQAASDGTFAKTPLGGYTNPYLIGPNPEDIPGEWTLVARGTASGNTATAKFELLAPTLKVSAINVGNSVVTAFYTGTRWYTGEQVSLWITDGLGNTLPAKGSNQILYTWADKAGNIPDPSFVGFIFGGTAGEYWLTAYGNTSLTYVWTPFQAAQIGGAAIIGNSIVTK